ncbi:hypothetical protein [Emticicia oligotrophica]|uniref:hypothetical protein n=1 Tax=Emticicia oligotrophica TaxID=312279 RepID=UPI00273C5585|nr:hypothetical protein [Emticicia oligotrophica]
MQDLKQLYDLRSNFLIIGLTGRLGSGCTTVADILTKEKFTDCNFPVPHNDKFDGNEERKYRIAYNFLEQNWKQFQLIRASDIIVAILLQKNYEEVKIFIAQKYHIQVTDKLFTEIESEFERLKLITKDVFEHPKKLNEKAVNTILEDKELNNFSAFLKEKFKDLTSSDIGSPFQFFGDNIRKTGNPLDDSDENFNLSNAYIIAELIKQLIQQYRNNNGKIARIVIDSIRNSFEARYFRERYSAFYLFAINTEDKYRVERLSEGYSKKQILSLDNEYLKNLETKDTFYKQDIKSCIQMSDIYLYNPNDDSECGDSKRTIKMSVLRYLTLIYQPGIITPTSEERTMQIAYTAKYNSGCISRQVGAVVTDKFFSVKSIGWNNTPQGQTPCLLRNADDLVKNTDNISFSEHEKTDEIKELVQETVVVHASTLSGRNPCFCFKQVQNTLEGQKNQVHTRSLHAEENAMLQISKYGGEGLLNGNLFTTASPCELCSKKAYQLGIERIYYIDPYPGIATNQILKSGTHVPKLILFNGAVGKAYHSIFEPFMAYKDELEIRLDIDFKKTKSELNKKQPNYNSKRIEELKKLQENITKELSQLEEKSAES